MTAHAAPPAHADRQPGRLQLTTVAVLLGLLVAAVLAALVTGPERAYAAAQARVELGTTASYSVLGGQSVTNTGPSVLDADLGVSPGQSVTGFPPGLVGGAVHAGDAAAGQAQSDLVIAYNDAAGRASDGAISADLGNSTLVGGVYTASSSAQLTGTVTLDGQDDPNSVFIFQIGSALTTATDSTVALINGAQACNVFWQIGSSATLGVRTDFVGTVLALTSVTATTDATIDGRLLARNGSVTLDSNVFTSSACDRSTSSPSATDSPGATDSPSASGSGTPTSRRARPSSRPRVRAARPPGRVGVDRVRVAGAAPAGAGPVGAARTAPAEDWPPPGAAARPPPSGSAASCSCSPVRASWSRGSSAPGHDVAPERPAGHRPSTTTTRPRRIRAPGSGRFSGLPEPNRTRS